MVLGVFLGAFSSWVITRRLDLEESSLQNGRARRDMAFIITIFIGSVLLFQVQPMIAKFILPWYGGSPAVWSTCLLFFQVGLLLGYTYAHLLVRFLDKRKQVIVHCSLLFVSLILLPVTPDESLKPIGTENPTLGIIRLLLLTVGIPYMLVSTTGPLVQHWFSKRYVNKSPYRLYALSNLGSLLGLMTYPFLLEPLLDLKSQTYLWTGGYGVYMIACCWCASILYRADSKASETAEGSPTASAEETKGGKLGFMNPLLWLALSGCGSMVLMSSTNKITQDVAVIPFLWILPLSLYLITLIIAFDGPRWYKRWFWIPLFVLSIPASILLLDQAHGGDEMDIMVQVALYLFAMFTAAMVCHGELVRLKPRVQHLTGFYLMVSLGGALGGAFVNFLAPIMFSGFWEYHVSILLVISLAGFGLLRHYRNQRPKWILSTGATVWMVMLLVTGYFLNQNRTEFQDGMVASSRNFYGVLRVYDDDLGSDRERRKLYHGRINHGQQWIDPEKKDRATSYYDRHSGVGIALRRHPIKQAARDGISEEPIKVGVIGLGIGTLASYSRSQDEFVFYEIDPDVESIAREYFTYLSDAEGTIDVVIGDARISMEREFDEDGSGQFDILAVDAFSGDAIPLHLLTKEAFELYFKHLKPDGILAVHISNRHINLRPVVRTLAEQFEKRCFLIKNSSDSSNLIKSASWVLITDSDDFSDHERVEYYVREWDERDLEDILWTDHYSSLLNVLKR